MVELEISGPLTMQKRPKARKVKTASSPKILFIIVKIFIGSPPFAKLFSVLTSFSEMDLNNAPGF